MEFIHLPTRDYGLEIQSALEMTYTTAKAQIRKRLLNAEDGKVSEVVSRELCDSRDSYCRKHPTCYPQKLACVFDVYTKLMNKRLDETDKAFCY